MPFGDSQSKIYVTIVDGMLAVRSSENDAKAVKRETKSGQTVFERKYKSLTGKIKDVGFRSNDYNGKKWDDLVILIYDGNEHFQLSTPFPGKYALSFLRAIKNVDLKSEVTFNPWTKTVEGKVKAALFLNLAGVKESVPWYYTQDNPNGLPELEPYTIPGSNETKYSDVKRNNFLRNMVETELMPKLRALWQDKTMQNSAPVIEPPAIADLPDDDLPF